MDSQLEVIDFANKKTGQEPVFRFKFGAETICKRNVDMHVDKLLMCLDNRPLVRPV